MSGRGDDKSIEPAHQPWPCVTGGLPGEPLLPVRPPIVPTSRGIGEIMTESRVRRIAEEVGAKLVAGLEARLAKMAKPEADAAITLVESEVQRLALRLSDAEDQWRRTRTRHEAMFRRVEALETTAREIALAGSIGDKDFARRTSDDILAKMDASNSDASAVLMTPASETGWAIMDKDGLLLDKATLRPVSPPAPPRETGWAVMDDFGMVFASDGKVIGFVVADFPCAGCDIRWLASRAEAETLARLLGVGRAAELYKDTLEEVGDGDLHA